MIKKSQIKVFARSFNDNFTEYSLVNDVLSSTSNTSWSSWFWTKQRWRLSWVFHVHRNARTCSLSSRIASSSSIWLCSQSLKRNTPQWFPAPPTPQVPCSKPCWHMFTYAELKGTKIAFTGDFVSTSYSNSAFPSVSVTNLWISSNHSMEFTSVLFLLVMRSQ